MRLPGTQHAAAPIELTAMVDLERYPILSPDSPRLQEVLRRARAQMQATGACEVPQFTNTMTPCGPRWACRR